MSFTFVDKPISTDILANSQSDIQGNFDYLQASLNKDHQVVFGNTNATPFEGRHRQVSLNNVAVPSVTDGATAILFASGNELFYTNAALGASAVKLTLSSSNPVVATKGRTFLPGGVILQWGNIAPPSFQTITTVNFSSVGTQAFPNNCFGVWVTCKRLTSPTNVDTVYVQAFTATTFTYFNTSAAGIVGFSWMAIGN